jgi:chemotaxis protein MotA
VLRSILIPFTIALLVCLGLVLRPEFFDPLSLLLTLGGAVAVTGFSYSKSQLRGLWDAIAELLDGESVSADAHAHELRRLTELFRLHGIRALENQERHLKDGFLRYGVGLLVDLHNQEKIRLRLEHRLAHFAAGAEINRQILSTFGKLLPSFGLIGTLIGMVLLLGRLSALDPKGLPSALGLAVLTTLYGAIFANVVVAPILARLQSVAVEKESSMLLTRDWIVMIARGESATIAENFGAYRRERPTDKLEEWAPAGVPAPRRA